MESTERAVLTTRWVEAMRAYVDFLVWKLCVPPERSVVESSRVRERRAGGEAPIPGLSRMRCTRREPAEQPIRQKECADLVGGVEQQPVAGVQHDGQSEIG